MAGKCPKRKHKAGKDKYKKRKAKDKKRRRSSSSDSSSSSSSSSSSDSDRGGRRSSSKYRVGKKDLKLLKGAKAQKKEQQIQKLVDDTVRKGQPSKGRKEGEPNEATITHHAEAIARELKTVGSRDKKDHVYACLKSLGCKDEPDALKDAIRKLSIMRATVFPGPTSISDFPPAQLS